MINFKQVSYPIKLKEVNRIINIKDRLESSAEHSWGALIVADYFHTKCNYKIDLYKVFQLITIHDLIEIETGDISLLNEKDRLNKNEKDIAASKIVGTKIPLKLKDEYIQLFNEYQEKKTPEAIFAQACDKIEPMIQCAFNNEIWNNHGFTEENVRPKKDHFFKPFPDILNMHNTIIEHLIHKKALNTNSKNTSIPSTDNLKELENLYYLLKLKNIYRSGKIIERYESTADHTWGCAILSLLFLKIISKEKVIDKTKLIKTIIYHDIVEIESGDVHILDFKKQIGKTEKEKLALISIKKNISPITFKTIEKCYLEYKSKTTNEAQLTKAIDVLEPMIHWYIYTKDWKIHNFTEENLREQKEQYLEPFPELLNLFNLMIVELKKEKYI